MVGVDLFSGAGGMSLGAKMAGIAVRYAVEVDPHAAATYRTNHPEVTLLQKDIARIKLSDFSFPKGQDVIVFGGPPCQGFSTANQRTRSSSNPENWLFKHFLRVVKLIEPEWVVFENVKGISETEEGFFLKSTITQLTNLGYTVTSSVLNLMHHGGPQKRARVFVVGTKTKAAFEFPKELAKKVTVREAIVDLPELKSGASTNTLRYKKPPASKYARSLRGRMKECSGHLVSRNASYVLKRYPFIKPGQNWQAIPARLMKNYTDHYRCHTGIYHRLELDEPSIVIGNYRKNMLIHPKQHRGLSVREAARLQSFPDWYNFEGSIGFMQQQVGNAVPPLLANAVFKQLLHVDGNVK
jgi:DNA (cytosine-5)-methyltransferase 1